MSASDSSFDAPCEATPLAGSIASEDSGDSAFDAPAVAERTRAARRRKVFASESVETLCAFILVDGIIKMPYNFRHTVWASSPPRNILKIRVPLLASYFVRGPCASIARE